MLITQLDRMYHDDGTINDMAYYKALHDNYLVFLDWWISGKIPHRETFGENWDLVMINGVPVPPDEVIEAVSLEQWNEFAMMLRAYSTPRIMRMYRYLDDKWFLSATIRSIYTVAILELHRRGVL